jgi:hypothetical protein
MKQHFPFTFFSRIFVDTGVFADFRERTLGRVRSWKHAHTNY